MGEQHRAAESVELTILGMSCGHCVRAVSEALAAVPGVRVTAVAVGSARIEVEEPGAVARAIAAIDGAGFEARVQGAR